MRRFAIAIVMGTLWSSMVIGSSAVEPRRVEADAGATDPSIGVPNLAPIPTPTNGEEIVDMRTANSASFQTETPGIVRTDFFETPIHYRSGAGWERIDTTFQAADGRSRTSKDGPPADVKENLALSSSASFDSSAPADNDTFVVAGFTTDHANDPFLQVGRSIFQSRAFLRFNIEDTLKPDQWQALDAQVNLSMERGEVSNDGTPCSAHPMQVLRVTGAWASPVVWPGPTPSGTNVDPATTAQELSTSQSCPSPTNVNHTYTLGATGSSSGATLLETVQDWIDAPATNHGLAFRANKTTGLAPGESPEADADDLKRFTASGHTHAILCGVPGAGACVGEQHTGLNNYWAPALRVISKYKPIHLKRSGDAAGGTAQTYPSADGCYPEHGTPPPPNSPPNPVYSTPPAWWNEASACKVDLYWSGPPGEVTPPAGRKTIVLVHGGGWMARYNGSGEGRRLETTVQQYADAYAEKGYVVALIDYHQGLFSVVADHVALHADWAALHLLVLINHCGQRPSSDGLAPYSGPPAPDASAAPDECRPLLDSGLFAMAYNELALVLDSNGKNAFQRALELAVDDIQAAVAWVRNGAGMTWTPGKVFVVGQSAGAVSAISANYALDSTGNQRIDGTVAIGAGMFGDQYAISDPNRPMLPAIPTPPNTDRAAPLQIQDWEYDVAVPLPAPVLNGDRFSAGVWNSGRKTARYLRDRGYVVEMRSGCGQEHVPSPTKKAVFKNFVGESVAFLDNLAGATAVLPVRGMWSGATYFPKAVGQDLVEDQTTETVVGQNTVTTLKTHETRVADFNGDLVDDILWWSPQGGCNTLWYGQGDGSFARADLSYPDPANAEDDPDGDDMLQARAYNYNAVNSIEQATATQVIAGDFNADGASDLFWYTTTPQAKQLWYGKPDPYAGDGDSTGTFTRLEAVPPADSTSVVAGLFNEDACEDLYFHRAAGDDVVWYGEGCEPPTEGPPATGFTTASVSAPATSTVVVLRFDDQGAAAGVRDELLFVPAAGSAATVLRRDATGTFVSIDTSLVAPTSTSRYTGDFNDDGETDVFWYNAASTTAVTWFGGTAQGSFGACSQTSGPSGGYDASVGDYDHDGKTDLYFRSTGTGWELYYQGAAYVVGSACPASGPFTKVPQFEQMTNDRAGIVGSFDAVPGDDIFWHHTLSRQGLTTYPW